MNTSFCWIVAVVFQHSATYTQHIASEDFNLGVDTEIHTGFSMTKVWLALLILVLISWSQSLVVVTLVTK